MKKLYITLCTLVALNVEINLQAMEPGARSVEAPRANESAHNADTAQATQAHYEQLLKDQQQNAIKNGEQKAMNDQKTEDKETSIKKYSTRLDTGINEFGQKLSTSELLKNRIALESLTGKAYDGQSKIGDTSTTVNLSDTATSSQENPFFEESASIEQTSDRVNSMETVDLNNEEVSEQAKKVTDKSSFSKFLDNLSKRFFGENSENPEVQDAVSKVRADGEAKSWWSPTFDNIKFTEWFKNTMKYFRESLPTVSLFSSPKSGNAYAAKVSKAFDASTNEDGNEIFSSRFSTDSNDGSFGDFLTSKNSAQ